MLCGEVHDFNPVVFTKMDTAKYMYGFAVANARVSYPIPELGKKGEVFVMVENIFNQQYAYRPGYPMPSTWGSIGLSASFD
jgi:iron complex outermembrane receptor protein